MAQDPNQPQEIAQIDLDALRTTDPQRWNIVQAFQQSFGRFPTPNEVSQYRPAIQSQGVTGLLGAVAQAAAQDQLSPENLQKKADAKRAANQGAIDNQVNGLFQQTLGRDATADEKQHFGDMIASNQADSYTIGQALQALPEYTQKQDAGAIGDLRTAITQGDTDYFNKNILPSLTSQFAQSGRLVDSSSPAFAAAAAKAAEQQSSQREEYLAGLSYNNYGANRQQLINNYLGNTSRMNQLTDQNTAAQYAQLQQTQNINDYNTQYQAYEQYLQQMGRRTTSNGLGGALSGGVSGAAAGGMAGGPWGALAGGIIGAAGGYFKEKSASSGGGGLYGSY